LRRLSCLSLLIFFLLGVKEESFGWPWNKDMARQPALKPQAQPTPRPPEGSMPIQGKEASRSREQAANVQNPVPPTAESIDNGKRLFQIYCAVCHGVDGKGMGPAAAKFVPPPDITSAFFKARADGFLYETIRSGGPLMPAQGEALSPKERWDIVNYLRSLQEGER